MPKSGTFTLIMSDTMCFEVTESGRTLRLDFRPKTLRERAAMWRRSVIGSCVAIVEHCGDMVQVAFVCGYIVCLCAKTAVGVIPPKRRR